MPRRIDPDVLEAIRLEFVYGYEPPVVARHLRAFKMSIFKQTLYLYWNVMAWANMAVYITG